MSLYAKRLERGAVTGRRRGGDLGRAVGLYARSPIEMPLVLTPILPGRRKWRSPTHTIRVIDAGSDYCRWFKVSTPLDLYLLSIVLTFL